MLRTTGAAALLLAASAAPAQETAQEGAQQGDPVSSFRLPPGPATTPSPAQGPVDPEAPAPRPPRATPSLGAEPSPTPQPSPGPPAPASTASAAPRSAAPTATPSPRARPAPTPSPLARPAPAATQAAPESPVPPSATAPAATAAPPTTPAPERPRDWPWWLPTALLLAGLGLGAAIFLWRRRGAPGAALLAEPPETPLPTPEPPKPRPSPTPAPPAPPTEGPALALRLEPVELRLSPTEARLAYRLLVTNRGKAAAGPLLLAGDMIAAHAALPSARQLRPDSGELPTRHALAALPPGETATLAGELPLPLAQVMPIVIGEVPRFVPLARWMVIDESLGPTGEARVFALGQAGSGPGAPLTAFRLDRGPASHLQPGAREIDAAPWLSLDGVGAGG